MRRLAPRGLDVRHLLSQAGLVFAALVIVSPAILFFVWMASLSIKPEVDNAAYPPVLITTADHDDRVVPGHSFKYAATMQAAQRGDAPVLILIETKAGHGAGKPTQKVIEEQADILGFLVKSLGGPTARLGVTVDTERVLSR